MSEWLYIETQHIEIDKDLEEVAVWVKQNDFGSVYAIFTFEQIKKIHKDITPPE